MPLCMLNAIAKCSYAHDTDSNIHTGTMTTHCPMLVRSGVLAVRGDRGPESSDVSSERCTICEHNESKNTISS